MWLGLCLSFKFGLLYMGNVTNGHRWKVTDAVIDASVLERNCVFLSARQVRGQGNLSILSRSLLF